MSMELRNVIILGAGGNLGRFILEALVSDSQFIVSVVSRKGSSSAFPSHIRVHLVDGSYPEDQLRAAFQGQDAVVNLVPTIANFQIHKTIIDASVSAGVKRIVPSEFSDGNPTYVKLMEKSAIFQLKQDIEEYLRSKEDTGLSWSVFVNGGFFDWGLQTSFFGFDLTARTALLYDQGKLPVNFTLLSTTAAAVASTLKHPTLTANQYVRINSYRVSQQEILAALQKATGGEKWSVSHTTTEETFQEAFKKLALDSSDYHGTAAAILGTFFSNDLDTDYAAQGLLANERLGLPKAQPLDVVVKRIVKGEKV